MPNQNRLNIRELPSFLPSQDFVKNEEGLRLVAYICPGGIKTVGWGHAIEPHDGLKVGDTIMEDMALQLLDADLVKAYQSLFRLVHVPLSDTQQTALVSFIFNLGAGRFQASTLRQKLNRQEYDAAAQEFERWVYARDPRQGLVKLKGLSARRRREQMLFLGEGYQNKPLRPRPDTLPFRYRKPRSSVLRGSAARASILQKASAVCTGLFKIGH
jgi:lysozyme